MRLTAEIGSEIPPFCWMEGKLFAAWAGIGKNKLMTVLLLR